MDHISPYNTQDVNREPSRFSTPQSDISDSAIRARRSPLQERRRPACEYVPDNTSEVVSLHASPLPNDRSAQSGDELTTDSNASTSDEHVSRFRGEREPLLPLFSAAQLDVLPVFSITHKTRSIIDSRCETTLSWDQLRSPQVSQFLVKPIQQQIKASLFSKCILYALIANCLQFSKESQANPGVSGVCQTKAYICEILAIKLLREFSARDLIDALSYDFCPMQGLSDSSSPLAPGPKKTMLATRRKAHARVARTSTLEVAIRAQSKRFLAHPLVVHHLEAIWAGTIVFHSAADRLHRPQRLASTDFFGTYGVQHDSVEGSSGIFGRLRPTKQREHIVPSAALQRRTVTLYNPSEASLFKLSRLRVPRYRQFLSTCSLTILLGLYLAVLIERSSSITMLEIIFWCWSVGFLLDEIVGFNEQGFSLYIMSFWNSFDIVILSLLGCYLCVRLYGVVVSQPAQHLQAANLAYDLLAANAVLLFPRLFSVIDHYRYFSQLLIAFRTMAVDLMAILFLILVACSGFFVAFTLSFGGDTFDAASVAYALFQILMGFTPAAWEYWSTYNALGRAILMLFLFICHFLIVTILISVLTNSFMAVVRNANEEHQFVFAVNTISMVKSDALFCYIAPANVLGWVVAPLRFFISLRRFVRINRTIIKITHMPLLFSIYAFERVLLRQWNEERDHDTQPTTTGASPKALQKSHFSILRPFSPRQHRLREPSIATFHKDKALAEVFRVPLQHGGRRNSQTKRFTSDNVDRWMADVAPRGSPSPHTERGRSLGVRPSARRGLNSSAYLLARRAGRPSATSANSLRSMSRSVAGLSPAVRRDNVPRVLRSTSSLILPPSRQVSQQTTQSVLDSPVYTSHEVGRDNEYTTTQQSPKDEKLRHISPEGEHIRDQNGDQVSIASELNVSARGRKQHQRISSTNTMIFDPRATSEDMVLLSNQSPHSELQRGQKLMVDPSFQTRPLAERQAKQNVRQLRPIMPPRRMFKSSPAVAGMVAISSPRRDRQGYDTMGLGSDLGDNKAVGGGYAGAADGWPASLATEFTIGERYRQSRMRLRAPMPSRETQLPLRQLVNRQYSDIEEGSDQDSAEESDEDDQTEAQTRMGKLVLARMSTLEESFRDVIHEVRELRRDKKQIIPTKARPASIARGRKVQPSRNVRTASAKVTTRELAPVGAIEDSLSSIQNRDEGIGQTQDYVLGSNTMTNTMDTTVVPQKQGSKENNDLRQHSL